MNNRLTKWILTLVMVIVVSGVAACGKTNTTTTTTTTSKTTATSSAAGSTTTTTKATTPSTTTTTAPPTPTGTLVIALGFNFGSADPSLGSTVINNTVHWPMFDYLIGANLDGTPSKNGGVAKDWTITTGATSTTYTFNLRQGIKFQDGTEVTSADVKFSIQYFTRTKSASTRASTIRQVVDQITTPDPYTVVVTTKTPYGFLTYDLSRVEEEGIVLPSKYITDNGEDYFNSHPMGSGPYKFVDQLQGDHITYQAIDGAHWLYGVPKYKTLTFKTVSEEATRIAMLKTGGADVIELTAEQAKTLGTGYGTYRKTGTVSVQVEFGNTWETGSFLADSRVREALNLALDRNQLNQYIYSGNGTVVGDTLFGSGGFGYAALTPYPYDPEKAKSLLSQAFPNGVTLTFDDVARPGSPELHNLNLAITDMWTKVGVKVNFQTVDYAAVFRPALIAGKLTNTVVTLPLTNSIKWTGFWQTVLYTKGQGPVVKDPKMDALVDAALAAQDIDSLSKAQAAVVQYARQMHYAAPILETAAPYAANQKVQKWNFGNRYYDPNFQDIVFPK